MSEKDEPGRKEKEDDATEEAPDRADETTDPSKGSGRKENVQPRPEDQRGRPDPKYKDSHSGG